MATDYLDSSMPSYRVYYPVADGLQKSLIRMVADFGLALPFEDLPRDTRLLAAPPCNCARNCRATSAGASPATARSMRWARCSSATRAPTSSAG